MALVSHTSSPPLISRSRNHLHLLTPAPTHQSLSRASWSATSALRQDEPVADGEPEPPLETLLWGSVMGPRHRRRRLLAGAFICYDRPSGRSNPSRAGTGNLSAHSEGARRSQGRRALARLIDFTVIAAFIPPVPTANGPRHVLIFCLLSANSHEHLNRRREREY